MVALASHDPANLSVEPLCIPAQGLVDGEGPGADDLGDLPLVAKAIGGPAVISQDWIEPELELLPRTVPFIPSVLIGISFSANGVLSYCLLHCSDSKVSPNA